MNNNLRTISHKIINIKLTYMYTLMITVSIFKTIIRLILEGQIYIH